MDVGGCSWGLPKSLAGAGSPQRAFKEGENSRRWWLRERAVHPSAQLLTGGSGAGLRITQPLLYLLSLEGSSALRFAAPLFPRRRTRINPSCPHLWGHRADGTSQRPACAGTPRWGWERLPKPSPNLPKGSVNRTDQRCSSAPGFCSPDTAREGGDHGPRHPSLTQGCPRCPGGDREGEGDPAAGRTGGDGEAEGLEEERRRGWGQDGAG